MNVYDVVAVVGAVALVGVVLYFYLKGDKDASEDGKKVESPSQEKGPVGQESASVCVRNDAKDGMEAKSGEVKSVEGLKEKQDGHGSEKKE